MATAISKPAASQPPKMKRPPPSFTQTNSVFNGIKQSPSTSSSPALASKRLPGANPPSANGIATPTINGALNRPVNRPRKDNQKPVDISTSRPQRATTRASAAEVDRRVTKSPREPLIKTTPYILKKYSKSPPSLILHLHPTHFRFDQQDGSFPYNSEMKVIIEHIREQTIPHDMLEELLRAGVKFYEGCLIVKVVDHKSASAQTNKTTVTSTDEKNTPFSIHNYNQHVTPSPYVPYPKQNQIKSEVNDLSKSDTPEKKSDAESADSAANGKPATENGTAGTANDSEKQSVHKPKVFTTVLYPTPLSFQAELTYLSTTPHPHANSSSVANKKQPTATQPQSKNSAGQPPSKRQKMLVDPEDLPKFEAALIRAVAPPVYLDPVDNFESAQELLKLMESPLHCARPPSPKRRKRTIAELAADEALAAEEERFMLIMDERLEPATSGAAAGAKIAVDDTAGAVPFEPRFSRFKTIENIRMQHEEKAKREHEKKLQQEQAKRQQQQEQDRERRRIMEQRQAQAEELAKEERRQQLAAQQAQLAAQQQQRLANGLAQVSQGQMSSPVVRNQTPHATSSPVVGNGIGTQGGVSMSMTASTQGAGSPPRPPSTMQHAHPGLMGHPMAPSRSQQNHSRNGTPQMTQGTPAMSHATPIMRNVTPTQRMAHGSPPNTTLTQTPVMGNAIMSTPQIGAGLGLTPQQQQQIMLQQRQQQILAAQQSGLTPQQFAHLQAQQNIQNHQHQQQLLNQQQQVQQNQMPQQHQLQQMQSHQAYQAQLIRNQMAQMQMAQHKQNQQQQGGMQMTPQQQQQQMLMAAAQANANQGQVPQTAQSARYQQMFKQRLQLLRADMQKRLQQQYGTPQQYPPPIAQQYYTGLETTARAWIQDIIRRETMQAQQRQQAAILQQQHQQQMMANGMGK